MTVEKTWRLKQAVNILGWIQGAMTICANLMAECDKYKDIQSHAQEMQEWAKLLTSWIDGINAIITDEE